MERILNMVDGAIVLVDAAEGVLPQTKFVVGKALARGLHPIVVVNKIDRPTPGADEVHIEVFDLFAALGATDSQLDFPMLYASGRQGWADAIAGRPAQGPVARCSTWCCATCRRRRWIRTRRSPWWRRSWNTTPTSAAC